jgi:hypothetical protein
MKHKDTSAPSQDFAFIRFPDIFVACMKYIFVFVCSIFSGLTCAQTQQLDLRTEWQVHQSGQYVPFTNQRAQSIHIALNSKAHHGFLHVIDRHEFSVFVNGVLAWRTADTLKINTDSLLRG